MEISELAILLTAKIDNLESQMEKAKKSVSGLSDHTKKHGNIITEAFQEIGKKLVVMAAAFLSVEAVFKSFEQMVAGVTDLDKSMNLLAIATGATKDQMELFGEYARTAGIKFGQSASDMTEAMLVLGREGFKTIGDMNTILVPSLQLAAATNTKVAASTELIYDTLKAYNLTAEDAAKVSDILTISQLKTSVSAQTLAGVLKAVSPTATVLHQNFMQVAIVTEMLIERLGSAGKATTSYMMFMNKLEKAFDSSGMAIGPLGKRLQELGITHEELAVKMKTPVDLLNMLHDKGLTTADAMQLFGGRIGANIAKMIDSKDAMADVQKAFGDLSDASSLASKSMETVEGRSKIMKATWDTLLITIGQQLAPALMALTTTFTNLLITLMNDKETMTALQNTLGLVAQSVVMVAGAIITAMPMFKLLGDFMSGNFKGVIKDFDDLKERVATFGTAFHKIGTTIADLKISDTLKAEMTKTSDLIKQHIGGALTEVTAKSNEESEKMKKIHQALNLKLIEMEGDKIAILKAKQDEELQGYIEKLGAHHSLISALKKAQARQLADEEQKINSDLQRSRLEEEGKTLEALKIKQIEEYQEFARTHHDKLQLAQFASTQQMKYNHEVTAEARKEYAKDLADDKNTTLQKINLLTDYKTKFILSIEQQKAAEQDKLDLQKRLMAEYKAAFETTTSACSAGFTELFNEMKTGAYDSQKIFESFARSVGKALLHSIAQICLGEAAKAAVAAAANAAAAGYAAPAMAAYLSPYVVAAVAGAAVAEGLAASLANGGIVSSPLLAVVGDNPNSPEVVAPLDKLAEMMQPRVTSTGAQEPSGSKSNSGGQTINLVFNHNPQMSFASPTEMRNATQTIIRGLQAYGYQAA